MYQIDSWKIEIRKWILSPFLPIFIYTPLIACTFFNTFIDRANNYDSREGVATAGNPSSSG